MKKLLEFATNVKTLIAVFLSLIAAGAWGLDRLHKPYVLKTELLTIFNLRDINAHQVNITKLQIRKGLALNKLKQNEFTMLISIEKLQILKLKGEKYGPN